MAHYFPCETILIDVVNDFNKRNETTIGYLRNQYNALEKYAVAYCQDHNKYLVSQRDGKETGVNFRFRKALFDAVCSARSVSTLLNAREVSTLAHFTPMIIDDNSGSTRCHKEFLEQYQYYLSNPLGFREQQQAFYGLCKLIYLVRCNVAHTGKSSFGPNKAKIERDNSIAQLVVNINNLLFNIIMNHPERKLACYGTLINSPYLEQFSAKDGTVNGFLETTEGLTYFTYELHTSVVVVKLYQHTSAINFEDIDTYEGKAYERILIPVKCGNEMHIANIYERKYIYA